MKFVLLVLVLASLAISPAPQKYATLTFDDGPWPKYTKQILDILDEYQIKATFFVIGLHIEGRERILKEVVARGHIIGNHTYTHPDVTQLSAKQIEEEILKTENLIDSICPGACSKFFRPPAFSIDRDSAIKISGLGYLIVFRTVDPVDWSRETTTQQIVERVLKGCTHNKEIIILHDGGGNRSRTVAALPDIIDGLKAAGYKFVGLSEYFEK